MVTPTRLNRPAPKPIPNSRDPWPVWGSLIVGFGVFVSGMLFGFGLAAGWRLARALFP